MDEVVAGVAVVVVVGLVEGEEGGEATTLITRDPLIMLQVRRKKL